ncbi:hypothetical protein Cgig2_009506 [Carnegiea gigantea]|uniref:Uncharacterized protein n=1 Tax=Carnegiea gigantea TaxID=171969 RepID=A0A9Q1GTS6_9CARY|nr:hypothetical protein Cgig2_009506 [Carnegiea gigantea]
MILCENLTRLQVQVSWPFLFVRRKLSLALKVVGYVTWSHGFGDGVSDMVGVGLMEGFWIAFYLHLQVRMSHRRIRVVRIETTNDNQRIVGLLIPNAAVEDVLQELKDQGTPAISILPSLLLGRWLANVPMRVGGWGATEEEERGGDRESIWEKGRERTRDQEKGRMPTLEVEGSKRGVRSGGERD